MIFFDKNKANKQDICLDILISYITLWTEKYLD